MCQKLIATLKKAPKLTATLKKVIIKEYPELENLVITPSNEEQKFKSFSKYGFDEVICKKVKGEILEVKPSLEKQNFKGLFEEINVDEIETEEVNIVPSTEQQIKEGLFSKVTVEKIIGDNLEITPTLEEQNFNGVYTDVKVNSISENEVSVTPKAEEQVIEGVFTKVTVDGSEDFQSQNIVKDKNVFGLIGTYDGIDTSDATALASDIAEGKTAYANGVKLEGTLASDYNAKVERDSNATSVTLPKMLRKIGTIDLTGVVELTNAFYDFPALEEVEFTNANSIQYMSKAFYNCSSLKKAPNMDLTNVKDAGQLFRGCSNLEGELDFSNIKELQYADYMFYGCSKVTKIKLGDILATSLAYLCGSCNNLTEFIIGDTSNVKEMKNMFTNCYKLSSSPSMNTSNVTNMEYMFQYCSDMLSVSQIDTSKVTSMRYMFQNCTKLTDVPELNGESCIYIAGIFGGCTKIVNFGGIKDLGKAYTQKTKNYSNYKFDLSYPSSTITHDSLMNTINGLYDLNLTYNVANGGTLYTQTLNLGSTNKNKLTAEEIAIATTKGWNVT